MKKQNGYRLADWLNRSFACDCGRTHAVNLMEAVIDQQAYSHLAAHCQKAGFHKVCIVCDDNTWRVAGQSVKAALDQTEVQSTAVFAAHNEQGEVAADERTLIDVIVQIPPDADAVIAAGSGTIHDIVRFVSYKMGMRCLSVPSAPSVDGFISAGAPIILRGFKQTIPCHSPEAIFVHPDVLSKAPSAMIAAGFGDLLGKFPSLADWKLGRLLQGEYFCEQAEAMTRRAVQACVSHRDNIKSRSPEGMTLLMEALIFSGISMLMAGSSRPASGGEHHLSHFWEMKGLTAGRKAVLHGAKVGVACLKTAELYQKIAQMDADEARRRLQNFQPASPEEERMQIQSVFGPIAPQLIRENDLDEHGVGEEDAKLAKVIIQKWDQIRTIAQEIPAPQEMTRWLKEMEGPVTTEELSIPHEWVAEGLNNAHFIRKRFSILRLSRLLSLD